MNSFSPQLPVPQTNAGFGVAGGAAEVGPGSSLPLQDGVDSSANDVRNRAKPLLIRERMCGDGFIGVEG